MRVFLRDKILYHSDPDEQRKEIEHLIAQGELKEFKVGEERITLIDPKGNPKREAVLHLDTLHKLQMSMGFAKHEGNKQTADLFENAIERLHGMYPDMVRFEKLYLERESGMKEKWGK